MRFAAQKLSFPKPSPFELYLPQGPASVPFPLICINPILGRLVFLEDLFFERRFARFFASNGLAAALMDRPLFQFNPSGGLGQIQEYLEASVWRAKGVLDFLSRRPEIDSERMGSFGISFGAVVNSLWAACDERLRTHVFALAGGNLPEIFVTSRDPLMRSYLKAIQKSGGDSRNPLTLPSPLEGERVKGEGKTRDEDLKNDLRKAITLDPLKVASSIPQENVLMILGIFDRVIRFRYGLALWRALGKPKTLFVPLGHYTSILAIPFLKRQILGFFKSKFDLKTAALPSS